MAVLSWSAGLLRSGQRAKLVPVIFLCAVGLVLTGCRTAPGEAVAQGCPSGFDFVPGTPAGTYMITVTATSGRLTHSLTVPLTAPAQ